MRTHGRQPVSCGEYLLVLDVPGTVDHCPFLFQIAHALLRDRRPDNVTRKLLYCLFIFCAYSFAGKHLKAEWDFSVKTKADDQEYIDELQDYIMNYALNFNVNS